MGAKEIGLDPMVQALTQDEEAPLLTVSYLSQQPPPKSILDSGRTLWSRGDTVDAAWAGVAGDRKLQKSMSLPIVQKAGL